MLQCKRSSFNRYLKDCLVDKIGGQNWIQTSQVINKVCMSLRLGLGDGQKWILMSGMFLWLIGRGDLQMLMFLEHLFKVGPVAIIFLGWFFLRANLVSVIYRVINLMIHCSFSFFWVFLVFVYVFSLIILELLLASLIELLLKIFDDCGTIVPQGCLD